MTWLSGWNEVDRLMIALCGQSSKEDCPPILEEGVCSSAIRERTAGVLSRKLPCPRLEVIANTVLAHNIMALSQAREILQQIGPEVIPLKGLYLINRFYPLGERDLGDLDLLVRKERVPEIVSKLHQLGFSPSVPLEKVLEGSGAYLNSIALTRKASLPVHLHWHVVNASLPLFMVHIPVEELWSESTETTVADLPVRALSPHHLLVTLSEHALKHSYEAFIHLLDIDRVVRSGVDIPGSFACARRWGVEPSLQMGLYLCAKMLGTPVGVQMPRGLLPRLIIRSVRQNRRWPGIGSLGYLAMTRGIRQKFRFLLGTFMPPAHEVESFGKRAGFCRVLHRGWRALLGGRRALTG